MADLKFELSEMLMLGAALRGMGSSCSSMEEAGQRLVSHLWERITAADPHREALALARFYKTHRFGDLDGGLQGFATGILGGQPPDPDTKCLVLLATRGTEPAWNDRRASQGHQAIPLPDPAFVARIPMVSEVFRQFGIEPGSLLRADPAQLAEMERKQCGVFLVADPAGSTFIPAQDFVLRHGVRSVAAFGGVFPNGDLFATLLFSRLSISREVADLLAPLALNMKLALLHFNSGRVFA
jgi:two-component system, NtrC family, sensor kinase